MAAEPTEQAVIQAPFGRIRLRLSQGELRRIEFVAPGTPLQRPRAAATRRTARELERYFADSRRSFTVPLRLQGTPFQRRVWRKLAGLRPGRTRTYGELAQELGTSARAIGAACRRNPIPIVIPCHRVVAAADLGGYGGARAGALLAVKRWLLEHERALSAEAGELDERDRRSRRGRAFPRRAVARARPE